MASRKRSRSMNVLAIAMEPGLTCWTSSANGATPSEIRYVSDGSATTAGCAVRIRSSQLVPLRRAPTRNTTRSRSALSVRPIPVCCPRPMAMRAASVERLMAELSDDDLVLDVGGWIQPFTRADWVIDLMPYETRGRFGAQGGDAERFGPDSWIERDICDHEPWPFEDNQFDFVTCAHTLEDVRDPVWVCHELNRVARAGYIEVPSRLEEHTYGFQGPWVGWGHHRWLIDIGDNRIEFVMKHHVIHGPEANFFPSTFYETLSEEQK